jgi:hypothetical protein
MAAVRARAATAVRQGGDDLLGNHGESEPARNLSTLDPPRRSR